MFSDDIFNAKSSILHSIRIDNAYEEIYSKQHVINMLTRMNLLILISDHQQPGEIMTDQEKNRLLDYARQMATYEYESRMVDGYESESD